MMSVQPGRPVFDLDTGHPCLDFANTLTTSGQEHITSYADLLAFAEQSQLLTPDEAAWLRAEGERDPVVADGVVVRARNLRAALKSLFSALARGKVPTERDRAVLNGNLAVSMSHAMVLPNAADDGFHWDWGGHDLDTPLWPITRSAADLLTSDHDRPLIRECGAEDCRWLFLDTTRNRSRQWCSMQSCGNRQKARRHYERVRGDRTRSA
jgi:predicted RNA-binding Zn ribbon-like protein